MATLHSDAQGGQSFVRRLPREMRAPSRPLVALAKPRRVRQRMSGWRVHGTLVSMWSASYMCANRRSGTMLNCRLHKCPQYCHQLHDHSKMPCERIVESKCAKGHKLRRKCHQSQSPCRTCELDDKRRRREIELDFDIQTRRDEAQAEHAAHIADLGRQIRTVREEAADKRLAAEQLQALKQKKHELEAAKKLAESAQPAVDAGKNHGSANNAAAPSEAPTKASTRVDESTKMDASAQSKKSASIKDPRGNEHLKSASEMEWERQKRVDGASNDAIDALMDMTGLEEVKSKILGIKAKIETVARQGADMKRERLGMVMLGNPGTGTCRHSVHCNLSLMYTQAKRRWHGSMPSSLLLCRRYPGMNS